MSTRQYVGARYVPRFSNPIEWDANRIYEALEMVTYLNATYTSKKPVPQGIDINNREYWVLSANYNAQVEIYRQEVEQVKTDIDSINNELNKRFNRKILFMGDSYDSTSGWVAKTANMLGLSSDKYFNIAQSGHGFYQSTWLNDLKSWVSQNPNEVSNIGMIVIGGGLNDSTNDNVLALGTNMRAFSEYAHNTFTDCEINLAYFGWRIESMPDPINRTAYYRAKCMREYSFARLYKMNYLPGCECCLHERILMGDDGVHPTSLGGSFIAYCVANAMKTGQATVYKIGSGTFTPSSGNFTVYLTQSIHNNSLKTNIAMAANNLNISFTGGVPVDIGEIKFEFSNKISPIQMPINVKLSDGTFVTGLFKLVVENDRLKMTYLNIGADKRSFDNITITDILSFDYNVDDNALLD